MSRNLVVCCDGTNNEVAGDATNVLRLYRMLERNEQQIAFYDGGVGTIPNADRITGWGQQIERSGVAASGLWASLLTGPAATLVDPHGEQNDGTQYDLLQVTFHAQQIHPVLDHCDDERADQRAKHLRTTPSAMRAD